MNIAQFQQLLSHAMHEQNTLHQNAENAIRALEKDDTKLYNSLLIEVIRQARDSMPMNDIITTLALILLQKNLKKNTVSLSIYEKIFGLRLEVNSLPQSHQIAPQILHQLVANQLKLNDDSLFNKYMALFDDQNQIRVALAAAELMFDDRDDTLLPYKEENIVRFQFLFDKLVTVLEMPEYAQSKELFHSLRSALESAEYLSNDSVRTLIMERSVALIDNNISFGYQLLSSCLHEIYEHLEPYMERIIKGIKMNTSNQNEIDDGDSLERLKALTDFWLNLCHLEIDKQVKLAEFSDFEISAPVQHLKLLKRYGDQILESLFGLFSSEEFSDIDEQFDHFACVKEILKEFDFVLLPKWDKFMFREAIFPKHNVTSRYENMRLKADTFSECRQIVVLRLPPLYLMKVLFATDSAQSQESVMTGSGQFLPMYDKKIQEQAFELHKMPLEEPYYGAFTEILRRRLARDNPNLVINCLSQKGPVEDFKREFKCYQYVAQLYNVPDTELQFFIEQCLNNWQADVSHLHHFIKPFLDELRLQNLQKRIYEKIKSVLEETVTPNWKDIIAVLGSLAQKLGAKLSNEIYQYVCSILPNSIPAIMSYHLFDVVASIVPPAGTSYLSHLETVMDLIERRINVSDDVLIECVIRSLTTVFHSFKKSSNEFLFVGQIKRIMNAIQPALENVPSFETTCAYFIFIKELCGLEQAPQLIRSASMDRLLQSASESSDRFLRSLAQSVAKQLFSEN
jgi:hypothetical protein